MLQIKPDIAYANLVKGLAGYFREFGKEKAVVGLSGGIDSAVVLAIASEALGNQNVHAILMPSPFSTLHSVTDAVELAGNLNIRHSIVPIEGIYHKFEKELEELLDRDIKGITLENLQARIRANILMAYSNNSGALLLNTSNKSEVAMGYGTLYGDLAGALMVIADLYKLQVYDIARYINNVTGNVIPESILTKEPSAELRDNQKDSDSFPEYKILDPILHALREEGENPEDLIARGAERIVIDRITRLINNSAFKAHQLPPVLQIGSYPVVPENKCIKCF
jgi:NAD+ synthase (glutamine-hydrolysing)